MNCLQRHAQQSCAPDPESRERVRRATAQQRREEAGGISREEVGARDYNGIVDARRGSMVEEVERTSAARARVRRVPVMTRRARRANTVVAEIVDDRRGGNGSINSSREWRGQQPICR